jgi:hypothetical protein
MLGQFGLLPLLKGWEYKEHVISRVIARGQSAELSIGEMGWILQVTLISNDSYGTLGFRYQGADLELHAVELNAEAALPFGAFTPDPSGYVSRYFRPNPYSTAGLFMLVWNLSGYFGAAFPYVPTVTARISLDTRSTQTEATVYGYAATIAITNKEDFLRSLRLALQSKADLGIDNALLSVGPAELGKSEKKASK